MVNARRGAGVDQRHQLPCDIHGPGRLPELIVYDVEGGPLLREPGHRGDEVGTVGSVKPGRADHVTRFGQGRADPDLACRERERSEAHTLTITLKPDIPSWDPEAATRAPNAFREQSVALPFILPPKTCFHAARVTDVYRNGAGSSIAVVVVVTFDVGFTDSAEYHATVFDVGRD